MSTQSISIESQEYKKQRERRAAILREIKHKLEALNVEQERFDNKIKQSLSNLIDAHLFDEHGIDVEVKETQLHMIANKLIELSKLRKAGNTSLMGTAQKELINLYKEFLT